MKYVEPDMDITRFDRKVITGQIGVSESEPNSNGGNEDNSNITDGMWD